MLTYAVEMDGGDHGTRERWTDRHYRDDYYKPHWKAARHDWKRPRWFRFIITITGRIIQIFQIILITTAIIYDQHRQQVAFWFTPGSTCGLYGRRNELPYRAGTQ